ncbi:MAG: 5' nucleotidase, NT5C type [Nannocystaceae bacterium]
MTRPTVLLDVDGVVADFTAQILRLTHSLFDRRFTPEDVTEWDYKSALGLSDKEWRLVSTIIGSKDFAFELPVYPGAISGVQDLAKVADIYFVTSDWRTSPTWVYDRNRWLELRFGRELGKQVIHTSHKHLVRGDVFVDDKPSNVAAWASAWPSGIPVLWKRPYNDGVSNSWEALRQTVEMQAVG